MGHRLGIRATAGLACALGFLAAGCGVSGTAKVDPVCPTEHSNLSARFVEEINEGTTEHPTSQIVPIQASRQGGIQTGRLVEGDSFFRIPTPVIFQHGRWVDLYPACFSEEVQVRVNALRDRAAATGENAIDTLLVRTNEYRSLIDALELSRSDGG